MADDRMYIRCKHCGKMLFIGKVFNGERYSTSPYTPSVAGARLESFFEKHKACTEKFPADKVQQYELIYESQVDDGMTCKCKFDKKTGILDISEKKKFRLFKPKNSITIKEFIGNLEESEFQK